MSPTSSALNVNSSAPSLMAASGKASLKSAPVPFPADSVGVAPNIREE